MVRVYGACIEPGGIELDNDHDDAPCPTCRKPARHHYFEQVDGGCINVHHTIDCDHCGHRSGYDFLMP